MKRLKICSLITAAMMTASMTAQGSCLIANADSTVSTEKAVTDEVKAEATVEAEADATEKVEEEATEVAEPEATVEAETDAAEKVEAEATEKAEEDATEVAEADVESYEVEAISAVAEEASVSVRMLDVNTSSSTNQLGLRFEVTNDSNVPVDISKLALSYYYTEDGSQRQNFWCDYSGMTSGEYRGLTEFVTGTISDYNAEDADKELRITFGSGAGKLAPGQKFVVQTRVAKEDWTSYDQSNDYSFNDNEKVTAELDGETVFGEAPIGGVSNSTITPDSQTYDQANPTDITVNMTLKGNVLDGIMNGTTKLVEGTDYKVNGTTVTFTKAYLDSLAIRDHEFTFDFNQGKDRTFKLTVEGVIPQPVISPESGLYNKKDPADVLVDMDLKGDKLDKIMNGTKKLVEGTDYVVDGTKVTFTKDFLDSLKDGSTNNLNFVFQSGKKCVYKLTIAGENQLMFELGDVEGKPGETVTVPVSIKGVNKYGINAFNFVLNYDTTKFENVTVEPVNIPATERTLFVKVNKEIGEIKSTFTESTGEDNPEEMIFDDGVLMNITMKIKDDATAGVSTIKNLNKGKFGYSESLASLKNYTVIRKDGSVKINGPIDVENKITPNTIKIKKGKASATDVSYSGNELNSIEGLTKGKDYTMTDGKVTLTADYLNKLTADTTLTFDFAEENDPTLTINVIDDDTPIVENRITPDTIEIEKGKASATDVSYSGNELVGIKGLSEGKDYTMSDGKVTLSADYLNKLTADATLTFDFNKGTDQVLTIKVGDPKPAGLSISTESVEAKPGETFKVAFTMSDVPEEGVVGCTLNLNYDPSVLEVVNDEAGEIIENPVSDYFSRVSEEDKMIYLNAAALDLIKKSGTVFYVTFKVKDNAASGVTKLVSDGESFFLGKDGNETKGQFKMGDITIK